MVVFNDKKVINAQRYTMTVNGEDSTIDLYRNEGAVTEEGTPLNAQVFNMAFQAKQDNLVLPENGGLEITSNTDGSNVISVKDYKEVDYTGIPKVMSSDKFSFDYVHWIAQPIHEGNSLALMTVMDKVFKGFDVSVEIGEVYSVTESPCMVLRIVEQTNPLNYIEAQYDFINKTATAKKFIAGLEIISRTVENVNITGLRLVRQTNPSGGYIYKMLDGSNMLGQIETPDTSSDIIEIGTNGCNAQLKFWKIKG